MLCEAIVHGHRRIVALLLTHGAETDGAMMAALQPPYHPAIVTMLRKGVTMPVGVDEHGRTAWHLTALQSPTLLRIVASQQALCEGAGRDHRGRTALHYTAGQPDARSVALLLALGLNGAVRCHDGSSPTHIAAAVGNIAVLKKLAE